MDGISYLIFKRCPALLASLVELFNCCWSQQSVPHEWKYGVIKLIPKQGAETHRDHPSFFRLIALTSCVGKLYTNILKDRWTSYLVANKYWSTTSQKAFLPGVPGCLEHQFVLSETLHDAQRRSAAVGLILRKRIWERPPQSYSLAIQCYHGSIHFCNVVQNLYQDIRAIVQTNDWTTPCFNYRVGVFQETRCL